MFLIRTLSSELQFGFLEFHQIVFLLLGGLLGRLLGGLLGRLLFATYDGCGKARTHRLVCAVSVLTYLLDTVFDRFSGIDGFLRSVLQKSKQT